MKLIIFLFSYLAIAQSLPIRVQEEGISNYQINANNPGSTPLAGYKYLYDQNSVLMRKDNSGNVERVRGLDTNNIIGNPDIEQGLTPYFISSGGMTLNETTPLEGKRSIDFDATATDDFVETQLYTIPIGIMGQNCMARVLVKGGDANLQAQVVNGNNQIIVFKQLETFADAISQYLTFRCPTQAEVTTTPQLGQFKIKIVQTTATDAALVTLDKFYLGEFASNTLNVQGQSESFQADALAGYSNMIVYFTNTRVNTISKCGIVTNNSTNGLTYTAKKPCHVIFGWSNLSNGLNVGFGGVSLNAPSTTAHTSLAIGQILCDGQDPNSSSKVGCTWAGIPNIGDVIKAHSNGSGLSAGFNRSGAFITATPIPQLATIVNTNTPRAGFWGGKKWVVTAGCNWNRGAGVFGPFTINASCDDNARTLTGHSIADAASDGQLPQVTYSKFPKGNYHCSSSGFHQAQTANTGSNFNLAINGVAVSTNQGMTIVAGSQGSPVMDYYFYNPSDLINAIISIGASGGVSGIISSISDFSINCTYLPDLSDPYSIPELYAALPPQVINSSGKIWRVESCYILNPAGTASLGSPSCSTWIQNVSRFANGKVRVTLIPNIFPQAPICNSNPKFEFPGNTGLISGMDLFQTITNSIIEISQVSGGNTQSDHDSELTCGGFQ